MCSACKQSESYPQAGRVVERASLRQTFPPLAPSRVKELSHKLLLLHSFRYLFSLGNMMLRPHNPFKESCACTAAHLLRPPGLAAIRKLGRHLAVVKSSNPNQEPSHQGPPCPGKSSGAQLCDNAGTHDMLPTHHLHKYQANYYRACPATATANPSRTPWATLGGVERAVITARAEQYSVG